jgi:hypothetical protein
MSLRLDHFFILADAAAADGLVDLGLEEGTPNTHPGQGTANRRFFFANMMLEILFIRDVEEARNGSGRKLRFWERATDRSASPFGLVFTKAQEETEAELFPGWTYQPDYLSDDQAFLVGDNSDLLVEPLCVCIPFRFSRPTHEARQADRFARVTDMNISLPAPDASSVLEIATRGELITLQSNGSHHMEMGLNGRIAGKTRDLRPELPLSVHW